MKVKMLSNYGVTADAKPWLKKGETVEVEKELGVLLLATRRAEVVAEKRSDNGETATAPRKKAERRSNSK